VATLLTRKPTDEDRGDVVGPRHQHRRSRVDDDNGTRVGFRDPGHERVLTTGQTERGAVDPLRLGLLGRADDHHRHVRVRGETGGDVDPPVDIAEIGLTAHAQRDEGHDPVDRHERLDNPHPNRTSRVQRNRDPGLRRFVEEPARVAGRPRGGRGQAAVDPQLEGANTRHRDDMVSVGRGREGAGQLEMGQLVDADALWGVAEPPHFAFAC
jgi:hypothetical protein